MLPLLAVGTLIAAAASEPDWKDELRQAHFRGDGLLVASWADSDRPTRWRLYRSKGTLLLREEGTRFVVGYLHPPTGGSEDWSIQSSQSHQVIFSEAFPSIWTLIRPGISAKEWEYHALQAAVRGGLTGAMGFVEETAKEVKSDPSLFTDWHGGLSAEHHPTWQSWWKAQLIKPSFVHGGFFLTPLERATGLKPLLTRSWPELESALTRGR